MTNLSHSRMRISFPITLEIMFENPKVTQEGDGYQRRYAYDGDLVHTSYPMLSYTNRGCLLSYRRLQTDEIVKCLQGAVEEVLDRALGNLGIDYAIEFGYNNDDTEWFPVVK